MAQWLPLSVDHGAWVLTARMGPFILQVVSVRMSHKIYQEQSALLVCFCYCYVFLCFICFLGTLCNIRTQTRAHGWLEGRAARTRSLIQCSGRVVRSRNRFLGLGIDRQTAAASHQPDTDSSHTRVEMKMRPGRIGNQDFISRESFDPFLCVAAPLERCRCAERERERDNQRERQRERHCEY